MALLFALCLSGRGRGGSSGTLGGRSGASIIVHTPIDCSTSNGIPEQVMCCYAKVGKFVSNIDGGGQEGVPVMDRPHTLVQYQCGHGTLLVLTFNKGASTGIGITHWFSTSMGMVHYPYWHSNMVPVLVLAFLHFGSVLV
jgi:hypothetical protein